MFKRLLKNLTRIFINEDGMNTVELLLIIAVICATAVILNSKIIPQLRNVHNTCVDRTGSIMGSGF